MIVSVLVFVYILRFMEVMTNIILNKILINCRFPLFGGWQTYYYIGYNVPTYEYLYHQGSHFVLNMRFVDHVFDDQVIDEVTVKIILPEGSR